MPDSISNRELRKAEKFAESEYPKEACGVFTKSLGFIPCTNIDPEPTRNFYMQEYLRVTANRDDVIALWHSHPNGNSGASYADMRAQLSTAMPWGITVLSTDGKCVDGFFWGNGLEMPLIGRKYRSGVNDCYSLIKDAYRAWYSLVLPEYARDADFIKRAGNMYKKHFTENNFEQIKAEEIKPGDIIILGDGRINHGAILLNERECLHHAFGELSRRSVVSPWLRCKNIYLRHKSFNGATPRPPKI
jgi:proteasome lid subunit RPN8/RPN11